MVYYVRQEKVIDGLGSDQIKFILLKLKTENIVIK